MAFYYIIRSDNRVGNVRRVLSFENGSVFVNGDCSEYAFCISRCKQLCTTYPFITDRSSFIKSAACFINHASKSDGLRVYQHFTQIRENFKVKKKNNDSYRRKST